MIPSDKIFQIYGEFAIYRNGSLFFGMTQFILLKRIQVEGSINGAAKKSQISYQQAWNVIDKMNKLSPIPLVIRQKGGVQGGGCKITAYGKSLLNLYETKLTTFKKGIAGLNDDLDKVFF